MNTPETKTCFFCKDEKLVECFGKNKREKEGLHYYCKDCIKLIKENKKEVCDAYYKQWRQNNAEKYKAYQKEYRKNNREKINAYQRNRPAEIKNRENRSEHKRSKERERRQEETHKKHRSAYLKEKYRTDEQYRLKKQFEAKLNSLLGKNDTTNNSINLIGCTMPEFKAYIEGKFLPTMSWENYGEDWNLDRIIPFCKWDLTDEEQQKKCFHYTNVQPLFVTTRVIYGIEYIGNMNKNKF